MNKDDQMTRQTEHGIDARIPFGRRARRFRKWVGRWLFHSLWSNDGAWTITKGDERYSLWVFIGPLDRPEGRAWLLTLWRWQLMFARAPEERDRHRRRGPPDLFGEGDDVQGAR